MRKLTYFCLVLSLTALFASAQIPFSEDQIRVFDAKGKPSSIDKIINSIGENEAVFLGEQHDDAVGHAVQMEIFKRAVEKYSADRKMALSLEMFERDIQVVVDEYLKGLISEAQFLASSRPWGNYKTDYRPLVELAKSKNLPVIAANAPRRYVNMVSRNGRSSLNGLSKEAKSWLPPLPYAEPSEAYATKFKALMGPSPEAQMGIDKILASQSLWDAGMSNSVYRFLKDNKRPLVIHLNGGFHTENRLGTFEHLMRYRPKTKGIVVTLRYEDDFKTFDKAKHTDLGDFVVLTDGKQPRSKR
ncbi:MAG: ChaN family lipoprotein [Pyrinomonadaceae bacterium]